MTEDKIYERYLHDNLFYYRISVITSFTKNSHSPREKRPYSKTGYTQTSDFNPHSHEGNDLICSFSLTFLIDFNPRSHEGNDSPASTPTANGPISIHVPTKGTTAFFFNFTSNSLFQSTFPRRERQHFSTIFPKILLLNITILHSSLVFSYRKNIKFIFFIHFCAFFLVRISLDFHVHLLLAHSFIESVFHLLQFLYLHQHVLLLFYIDFPNSKISNYLLLHHVHLLLAHSFIESVFHLLQFLYLHQHVLLLFYIDFPNSKISNYLLLHQ